MNWESPIMRIINFSNLISGSIFKCYKWNERTTLQGIEKKEVFTKVWIMGNNNSAWIASRKHAILSEDFWNWPYKNATHGKIKHKTKYEVGCLQNKGWTRSNFLSDLYLEENHLLLECALCARFLTPSPKAVRCFKEETWQYLTMGTSVLPWDSAETVWNICGDQRRFCSAF